MDFAIFAGVFLVILIGTFILGKVEETFDAIIWAVISFPFRLLRGAVGGQLDRHAEGLRRQHLYYQTVLPTPVVADILRSHYRNNAISQHNESVIMSEVPGCIVVGVLYASNIYLSDDAGRDVPRPSQPHLAAEVRYVQRGSGTCGTVAMVTLPDDPSDIEKAQEEVFRAYLLECIYDKDNTLHVVPEKDAVRQGLLGPGGELAPAHHSPQPYPVPQPHPVMQPYPASRPAHMPARPGSPPTVAPRPAPPRRFSPPPPPPPPPTTAPPTPARPTTAPLPPATSPVDLGKGPRVAQSSTPRATVEGVARTTPPPPPPPASWPSAT